MERSINKLSTNQKTLGKAERKILEFLETSPDISMTDRIKIQAELKHKNIREVFNLILVMFSWFSIATAGDIMFKSTVGSALYISDKMSSTSLLSTLGFNIANIGLKYLYLRTQFAHLLTRTEALWSVIPTLGLPIMIGILFKDTPNLARALTLYAKQQNPIARLSRSVSRGVKNILGKNPATT